MKVGLLITLLFACATMSFGQNVGIGTATPNPSAKLDINDANKGLLIPNVSLVDTSLASPVTTPAVGLLVWNTNATTVGGSGTGYYYWNGTTWVRMTHVNDPGEFKSINSVVQNTTDIANDDFVFGSTTLGYSTQPARMFFDKSKAAFRAGSSFGFVWESANIGRYSFAGGQNTIASGRASIAMGNGSAAVGSNSAAMGSNTIANGESSFAMGINTTANGNFSVATGNTTIASGQSSTAMGQSTIASGFYSTAMGHVTIASAYYSTAMGLTTRASGTASTAMGRLTTASGIYSVAMGYKDTASGYSSIAMGGITTASGNYSTAMGYNTTASGIYSTAMGKTVSTNNKIGSFIIGDNSTSIKTNSANNQMMMRFSGGYFLYTNAATSAGVRLSSGGSAWAVVSDSTKKENFISLKKEDVLSKIAAFNITEWNYKSQKKGIRHIGPMAQEFHSAFGLGVDNVSIVTSDISGVNMLAIQGLIEKINQLEKDNQLENKENDLAQKVLENKVNDLEQKLLEIATQVEKTQSANVLSEKTRQSEH